MNSIFSSFDAVCAEFMGQTVKASLPIIPFSSNNNNNKAIIQSQHKLISTTKNSNNNIKEGKSSSPPLSPPVSPSTPSQRKTAARFAPELDGLHCFESLVPFSF
ncbi:hypothetical protein LOK49_LG04G02942 [Camellia lanceoleosa]|uniref:Uncharacterized protein n=1 Tax=Camellia lanceoleosa TaxID=1840588 RepID=A0ACC0I4F3_9ERIC|nr:hypothetical protein LOK49_LG04G02942 [Camellia lanceoleosa]